MTEEKTFGGDTDLAYNFAYLILDAAKTMEADEAVMAVTFALSKILLISTTNKENALNGLRAVTASIQEMIETFEPDGEYRDGVIQ
jgi:hypothetical protein